jgi:uncharacterized protein (DUF924 family)
MPSMIGFMVIGSPLKDHSSVDMHSALILHFWFTELTEKQHFAKDAALDACIAQRFGATLEAGLRCELFGWRASPAGRLAEIIVLNQFSRHV